MLRTFVDGRLFGSVTGTSAPRVIALHGWARSHRDFDGVLAPSHEEPLDAIALDLPGFGASPPPPDAWGAIEYARLVAEVVRDIGSPVVVLGHSFGGRVALHLAALAPESVQALVVTGAPFLHPVGRRGTPALAYRIVRRLHSAGIVSDLRMEAARQRHGSPDYKAAQGIMRQVHVRAVNESDEQELAEVQCPVHLVWGADDTAAPLEVAERASALLTQSDLIVYPGVGHLTPTLIPDHLRRAVLACLP